MEQMGGFSQIVNLIQQESEHASASAQQSCESRLAQTFNTNRQLKNNLSKLTTLAWGADKNRCRQEMNYDQIRVFLSNVEKYGEELPAYLKNGNKTQSQSTSQPEIIVNQTSS